MTTTGSCLFRADANTQIGTGHVMRCLALAQAWQDAGGSVTFAMCDDNPVIEKRLKSENFSVSKIESKYGSAEDAYETIKIAQNINAEWIVVDGYHFGSAYQKIIKNAGLRLLFVDDNGHSDYYYADIVLNQNIHAQEEMYEKREAYTRLLLGTKYVLLRREFLKWRKWKREIPEVARKLLVTLGGGDPDNVTLKVIQSLQQVKVEKLESIVVVGGNNPHFDQLHEAVRNSSIHIQLKRDVNNISELMAWADMAVAAAGTTSWELCFFGLPSLLIILAENQRFIAEYLNEIGAAKTLGRHYKLVVKTLTKSLISLLTKRKRRYKMCKREKKVMDGLGCHRVVECIGK
ncbi:MAG: UDP-2,4-diacetamido-2,4,6-trideoxy-beta-L-altropyranose hydrolase [Planctomycetota bacterium]